ncbi:MAG: FixH family protein [Spirochaetia bacterium]|nr:FixH family protein [Spirochaetia bacterium]
MQTVNETPGLSRSMKNAFWMIGTFLTAAVIWLGCFVRIAVAHSEPAIDNRFFERGKSYNDRFRSLEEGRAAGLRIESNLSNGQSFQIHPIQATFQLKANVPIQQVHGTVVLERASTSRDRQVIPIESGNTTIALAPDKGLWDVRLEYTVNESLVVHRNIRITVQ